MLRTMLNGKIHQAAVTDANLHYPGSITIDPDIRDAANMLPGEQVHVFNINNGERFVTYVLEGERGSRQMVLNGAAARKVHVGDRIIVLSFAQLEEAEARRHKPNVVVLNEKNEVVRTHH